MNVQPMMRQWCTFDSKMTAWSFRVNTFLQIRSQKHVSKLPQTTLKYELTVFQTFLFPVLCALQSWTGPEKLLALDELIDSCEPTQVKHMMQVIEPQFQRDFISLLPKEVRPFTAFFLCFLNRKYI